VVLAGCEIQAKYAVPDCALALGQLGDRTVEGLLNELAQNDPSPVVRNACKEALEAIKK